MKRGFTLLEVMIAVAILAGALTALIRSVSQALAAENHAKLMTVANFLARERLVELEDELQEKGFTDDSFAKETSGEFSEQGFQRFRWTTVIDKIELPNTDQVQSLMSKGMEGSLANLPGAPQTGAATGAGSGSGLLGGSAGLLASQFGIIKEVLEQAIRRARVRVVWREGKREQNVEVVEYLTDPRRVDQSIMMGGASPPPTHGSGNLNPSPRSGR